MTCLVLGHLCTFFTEPPVALAERLQWGMHFKTLLAATFLLSFNAFGVAPTHFLYPRDLMALQLTGLETFASRARVLSIFSQCGEESSHALTLQLCQFLTDAQEQDSWFEVDSIFWNENAQVLFFGERHIDQESQFQMAALLEPLAQTGHKVLALEMLNSRDQSGVDMARNTDELMAVFTQSWNYQEAGYTALIEEARRLGMEIVALDDRRPSPFDFSEDLLRRDEHMAQVLTERLVQNPQEKIIVYSGRLHAYQVLSQGRKGAPTIKENMERELGPLSSESYFFVGASERTSFRDLKNYIEQPAHVMKLPSFLPYVHGLIFIP